MHRLKFHEAIVENYFILEHRLLDYDLSLIHLKSALECI